MLRVLLFLILYVNRVINGHPAPSPLLCHGFQTGVSYIYKYDTSIQLNNEGKEAIGFGFESKFAFQSLWEDKLNSLVKVSFHGNNGGNFLTRNGDKKQGIHDKKSRDGKDTFPIYAHVKTQFSGQDVSTNVVSFHVHHQEIPTRVNLKQTLLELTVLSKKDTKIEGGNRNSGQSSILIPDILNQWQIQSKTSQEHSFVTSSHGWQNITLRSRIYNNAHSHLYLTFDLKFLEEVTQHDDENQLFASAESIEEAIKLLGEDYIQKDYSSSLTGDQNDINKHEFNTHMVPEKSVCHDCRALSALVHDYEDFMQSDKAATVQASIAFLKLLESVRISGPGTSTEDMVSLLHKLDKDYKHDVLSSVLDVLAASRTEAAVTAALQFLDLEKNKDLDTSERFLTSLAASCVTASATSGVIDLANHRFIVEELYRILNRGHSWKSDKLRWTAFVTLASVSKSYTARIQSLMLTPTSKKMRDELEKDVLISKRVVDLIIKELSSCQDVDCKLSLLTSLANSGNLLDSFPVLEEYALDTKGKRESIAAMKVIKECLDEPSNQHLMNSTLKERLRILSLKVVYDDKHESTSRIIAAEIIVRHMKDPVLINQLLKAVYDGWFGNNEMVTLMWKRVLKFADEDTHITKNWFLHSTLLNGTSSAFTRNMGGTPTVNATYGVDMELLSHGNLLKESNFDFLIGDQKHKHHILSVGLFARGLESIAGVPGDGDTEMAGMQLKIMGTQLRPYNLFEGAVQAASHITFGTSKTVFQGNLLISDHEDNTPLINGFVVNQRLRGVLSLDLSGEISGNLIWYKTVHAVVRSKAAALMQGSQSILTSGVNTSVRQLFAFGGATAIETTTDVAFASDPFKMCVKMGEPDHLVLRHNTRKYEQVDSENVSRRTKRNFIYSAKSYPLHPKIQEVCESFN